MEQSVRFARLAKAAGVDHIDVSTGGLTADARVPVAPGYQAPFAATIRAEADLPANTVGIVDTSARAAALVEDGTVDAVMLGRPFLRDPNTVIKWATELGLEPAEWSPPQYATAGWRRYYGPA